MTVLIGIAVGLVAAPILVALITEEAIAQVSVLAGWIVRRSAARLPEPSAERYLEEWLAELEHMRGPLSQVARAWSIARCIRDLAHVTSISGAGSRDPEIEAAKAAVTADRPRPGLSSKRAAEIVGITYRQLDYWARTNHVRPTLITGSGGTRREYTYRDLLELRIVKQLLDAGIKLQTVRRVFKNLRTLVGDDVAGANLVIHDSSVALALDDGQLLQLVRGGQGVLNVMNLRQCQAELDARIVEFDPARDPGA